jgi:hypothetical protein
VSQHQFGNTIFATAPNCGACSAVMLLQPSRRICKIGNFPCWRHVNVPPFTDEELDAVRRQAPALNSILTTAPPEKASPTTRRQVDLLRYSPSVVGSVLGELSEFVCEDALGPCG